MIEPITCKHTLNLTGEPLGAVWLRRSETLPEITEFPCPNVWRTGPKGRFRSALIEAVDGACEIILVCAFLLADKELAAALLRAAERKVRVYILTASEQRIGKFLHEDDDFNQRMANEHKQLLDQFAGKILVRSAEHFHAKFLAVDHINPAKSSGFLSTANFNLALTENIELGICVQGKDVTELAELFNWAFWCEAKNELIEKGRLSQASPPPRHPKEPSMSSVKATLQSRQELRKTIASLIKEARGEILLCTYGIELSHEVTQALLEALNKNVKVTILTRPRPAIADALLKLAKSGATIFGHDKLHAKALVIDGAVWVMSANLESNGLDHGFEVGIQVVGEAADYIVITLRQWAGEFPWVFRADATRGEHLGEYLPFNKGLRDGIMHVIPKQFQPCADQVSFDALRLTEAPRPTMDPTLVQRETPQHVEFTWKVNPPKLPNKAKQRKVEKGANESTPQIYDHDGKVYILIKPGTDISAAQRLTLELSAIAVVP
ncbi:phospholipase D-like domain-containing protein [Terasakiella pusilla]|uniref:phospholipase D-like domain-containing protein n=1 Tax=Terasakiella pusilla TaxID=64973 RepID=UPI003AA9A6B7